MNRREFLISGAAAGGALLSAAAPQTGADAPSDEVKFCLFADLHFGRGQGDLFGVTPEKASLNPLDRTGRPILPMMQSVDMRLMGC